MSILLAFDPSEAVVITSSGHGQAKPQKQYNVYHQMTKKYEILDTQISIQKNRNQQPDAILKILYNTYIASRPACAHTHPGSNVASQSSSTIYLM